MTKESLIVKNFGPIKDAELDLRKVTVLIGEQASGKSVLAKLLAIFSDVLLDTFKLGRELKSYHIESFLSQNSFVKFKTPAFSRSYKDENSEIEIHKPELNGLVTAYRKAFVELLSRKLQQLPKDKQKKRPIRTLSSYYESQLKFGLLEREVKDSTIQSRYFPAERTLISTLSKSIFQLIENDVKIPGFLNEFASAFEIAKNELSEVDIPFLKIQYRFLDRASCGFS